MSKWEPQKGDYLLGARKILGAYVKNAFGYPEVNLKLAGEEANLTRTGHPEAKALLHRIVEEIKNASEPYRQGKGFKTAWVYFSEVPPNAPAGSTALPPEVQQQLANKLNRMLAKETTTNAYAQETMTA